MSPTNALARWFSAPIAFDLGTRARWRLSLLAGLAVFGILALYQPFGTYEDPLPNKHLILSGYGFATTLAFALCHLLARRWHSSQSPWTRGKHALFLITLWVVGSGANYGYYCWVFREPWMAQGLLRFLGFTFLVGIYPAALLSLTQRRKPKTESEKPQETPPSPREVEIVLEGENRDERLRLDPNRIFFVRAADNYCEVVFEADGGVQHKLLRSALTRLAAQLEATPILKCHRSYLVNPERVSHATGNSQSFRLHFEALDEQVPVARSFVQDIRQRLARANGPNHSPRA